MMIATPAFRQGLILAIAFMIFLLDGATTVDAFLRHDLSQEILGGAATVLAVLLGWLVQSGIMPKRIA